MYTSCWDWEKCEQGSAASPFHHCSSANHCRADKEESTQPHSGHRDERAVPADPVGGTCSHKGEAPANPRPAACHHHHWVPAGQKVATSPPPPTPAPMTTPSLASLQTDHLFSHKAKVSSNIPLWMCSPTQCLGKKPAAWPSPKHFISTCDSATIATTHEAHLPTHKQSLTGEASGMA